MHTFPSLSPRKTLANHLQRRRKHVIWGVKYLSMYRATLRGLLRTLSAYLLTALTSSKVITLSHILSLTTFRTGRSHTPFRLLPCILAPLSCSHSRQRYVKQDKKPRSWASVEQSQVVTSTQVCWACCTRWCESCITWPARKWV